LERIVDVFRRRNCDGNSDSHNTNVADALMEE
jgi:hypothetical protein